MTSPPIIGQVEPVTAAFVADLLRWPTARVAALEASLKHDARRRARWAKVGGSPEPPERLPELPSPSGY
jgi:hypothetical protein